MRSKSTPYWLVFCGFVLFLLFQILVSFVFWDGKLGSSGKEKVLSNSSSDDGAVMYQIENCNFSCFSSWILMEENKKISCLNVSPLVAFGIFWVEFLTCKRRYLRQGIFWRRLFLEGKRITPVIFSHPKSHPECWHVGSLATKKEHIHVSLSFIKRDFRRCGSMVNIF